MKRALVWFKTDLRLTDNDTVYQACQWADEVIPVYCFDESHFKNANFGCKKTGDFRVKFLLESLQNLAENLQKLGSNLIVCKGKPEEEIPKIALQYQVKRVFAKKEVAYEEKQTEAKVEKALWQNQIILEIFSTSTLFLANDLPFTIRDIPDVFTSFRKQVEHDSFVREVTPKITKITSPELPNPTWPTLENLNAKAIKPNSKAALDFVGGETEGLNRIHYYLFDSRKVSQYKLTRNGLIGEGFSTKFSPWLALGCISARYIYWEIKRYEKQFGSNESTYWVIFELLWRDYFRFAMKKYNHQFFLENGIRNEAKDLPKHDENKLKRWKEGKTGVKFVDANMVELRETGFMSNRGRQNVASYLVNDLKIDWRYGAAYFEEMLVDYDVCSNWGNWAYLAGVGNDPRSDRYFNIDKQRKTYDPNFEYIDLWLK